MRVYHFLKEKYAIEALKNRHLKIARLNALNDPYEYFHMETDNYLARVTLKERKNRANREYGLLCFSASYSSPVQWAHYAESHAGICLGFEVPDSSLIKIQYTEKRTPGSEFKDSLDIKGLEFIKHMLSKKHAHWNYEEEHRMLVRFPGKIMDDRLMFEPFSEKLQVSEVLLGARSKLSNKEIKSILRSNRLNVPISRVNLSEKSYSMKKVSVSV
ncbi:DUF2971 domain-containing protein [Pseudomonas sp. NPDC079086]|uniref:DUF2971 domain-containing protein n=1 Tax=unclassified Pseudomonas TaxID=196821 RepID=UPI0037C95EFB